MSWGVRRRHAKLRICAVADHRSASKRRDFRFSNASSLLTAEMSGPDPGLGSPPASARVHGHTCRAAVSVTSVLRFRDSDRECADCKSRRHATLASDAGGLEQIVGKTLPVRPFCWCHCTSSASNGCCVLHHRRLLAETSCADAAGGRLFDHRRRSGVCCVGGESRSIISNDGKLSPVSSLLGLASVQKKIITPEKETAGGLVLMVKTAAIWRLTPTIKYKPSRATTEVGILRPSLLISSLVWGPLTGVRKMLILR